jgi:hemolysin III
MDVARTKPTWRGHSHQAAFFAALGAGLVLVCAAPPARTAVTTVYVATLVALFGVSALYHRPMWPVRARDVMARLDHSMIFLFIAGTYTPFCELALPPATGRFVLSVMWTSALVLSATKVLGVKMPRWLMTASYVGLGWFAAWSIPEALPIIGVVPVVLLLGGGALYTIGAVVYWRKAPNPVPGVFGYHEVFHLLVVGAGVMHFVAVAGVVLRR